MNAERRARKNRGAGKARRRVHPRAHAHFPFKALDARLGALGDLRYPAACRRAALFRFRPALRARLRAPVRPLLQAKDLPRRTALHVRQRGLSLDQLYDGMGFLGPSIPRSSRPTTMPSPTCGRAKPRVRTSTARTSTSRSTAKTSFAARGHPRRGRADPIVGMGLLLDADCVPLGMRIHPGNESEKPVLKRAIDEMRRRGRDRQGRTRGRQRLELRGQRRRCRAVGRRLHLLQVRQAIAKSGGSHGSLSDEGWVDVAGVDGQARYSYKKVVGDFEYKGQQRERQEKSGGAARSAWPPTAPKFRQKQLAEINRQIERRGHCALPRRRSPSTATAPDT